MASRTPAHEVPAARADPGGSRFAADPGPGFGWPLFLSSDFLPQAAADTSTSAMAMRRMTPTIAVGRCPDLRSGTGNGPATG